MNNLEDKIHHGYTCHTGCGHTTLTDKYYKTRRTHCAVCGTKTEMQYLGEFKIERVSKFPKGVIDFGLS